MTIRHRETKKCTSRGMIKRRDWINLQGETEKYTGGLGEGRRNAKFLGQTQGHTEVNIEVVST